MSDAYLADACALLAFFGAGGATLSRAGRAAMAGDVAVSAMTVWELTRKAALGKLPPLPAMGGSFARYLAGQGFRATVLAWDDAEAANALPPLHKDPMDRLLIAQAKRLDLIVITDDAMFARYGAATIW